MHKAVIYCRVSSDRQATEGHGLSSQERSCRKFAAEQNLDVVEVFTDDYTGGGDFWKRPGIRELLSFLDAQDEPFAVIFDDLKRFARDTMFHLKLREELLSRNATPRCPNFRFDESPEGLFVETVIAATAELERKQNRRQVISRMKARLEDGHWVFPAPLGYRFEKVDGVKRVVPDSPTAEHVRTALEDFSSGKLPTMAAARAYLEEASRQSVSKQSIRNLLANEFYAGYCVCKKWDIRVKGRHEALIDEKTHRNILRRLDSLRAAPRTSKNLREDFPLRGDVVCVSCQRPFTAGWSRGRSARYPYYQCQTSGCAGSIAKKAMEERFVDRLDDAKPKPATFRLFEGALLKLFKDRTSLYERQEEAQRKRVEELAAEIEELFDSLRRSHSIPARRVYEERIEKLSTDKERLEDQPIETSELDVEPVLTKGRDLLQSPSQYWLSGGLRERRIAQKLVFEPPIPYGRKEGYRTAEFSLLYGLLGQFESTESSLVELLKPLLNPAAEEIRRWIKIFKKYLDSDDWMLGE